MKRTILTGMLTLSLVLATGTVKAQMGGPGMMTDDQDQSDTSRDQTYDNPYMGYPGMMGGYGYGMGPGMMGGGYGYGMGPGMMGGYGMGPGMMGGYGYGMGPGMMYGYGMGRGMHGYGMGPGMMYGYGNMPCPQGRYGGGYGPGFGRRGFASPEKYQKFLGETRELRKKLHDLMFDYREMARDPKTDEKQLAKTEKEIDDLRKQIWEKAEK